MATYIPFSRDQAFLLPPALKRIHLVTAPWQWLGGVATLAALVSALLRSAAGCWMEIITGVERRRRWRVEDKLCIVAEAEAEAEAEAAVVAHVARRHQVSRGLLTSWRQQVRRGGLVAEHHAAVLMPVQMLPKPVSSAVPVSCAPGGASGQDQRIEIALPDGISIRVGADVGLVALRRVIAAVRR